MLKSPDCSSKLAHVYIAPRSCVNQNKLEGSFRERDATPPPLSGGLQVAQFSFYQLCLRCKFSFQASE